jgi:hypothetical protein
VRSAALKSIAITSLPDKTVYAKGEALDITGLAVTGTYADKKTRTLSVTLDNISGYDADTIGTQILTVTVGGKTAEFTVTVTAAALQSIAVTSPPDKTVYAKGAALDITGMEVTGTYEDWTTGALTVTVHNISGYNANTVGTQTLTVTVNGKTAAFTVTVTAAALQSIAVTSPPDKTVYVKGESLDITGLAVTGTYADATTGALTVTPDNISGYDADTVGTQTLTVTVNGKTATFTVKVQANIGFTVNLDDPINGIPEGIVLSKSGSGEPASVDLTIDGTYADYAWYLNEDTNPVSTTGAYTLDAADCRLGTNVLTVEAKTSSGVHYAREITFTVNK